MSTALETLRRIIDQTTHKDEHYDLEALRYMSEADRAIAIPELERMARDDADWRALMTLARLGVPSSDEIARALQHRPSPVGFWARRALAERGHFDEARAGLVRDLEDGSTFIRFGAAMVLAKHKDPAAAFALLRGLEDPNDLVRIQSLEALVEQFDLQAHFNLPGTPHKNLLAPLAVQQLFVGSDNPALQRYAVGRLRGWFEALGKGQTAESLGIAYTDADGEAFRLRFGAAFRDGSSALPIDEVRATGPQNRHWAEALMVYNLTNGKRDERLPAALAQLQAVWTLPLLRDLVESLGPSDSFRPPVEAAIRQLESN